MAWHGERASGMAWHGAQERKSTRAQEHKSTEQEQEQGGTKQGQPLLQLINSGQEH
jgi:hypothetical protein